MLSSGKWDRTDVFSCAIGIFAYTTFIDPPQAPARFLVIKPISQFAANVNPEIVLFFARPEAICRLKSLSLFATNDMHVVKTPSFGPGCSGFVTWPMSE